jgi:DNA-binding CsgD family transcriptional regulator
VGSADHVDWLLRSRVLRRRLCGAGKVGALFALAAEMTVAEFGFERCVVLAVDGATLSASTTDALHDEPSDRLRRQALAAPVTVRSDTQEARLIRLMRPPRAGRPPAPSELARALALRSYALAPICPETRTLGLLVCDRRAPAVEPLEAAAVSAFADIVAGALAQVTLRARQHELASDLQHLTMSSQALLREMLESPVMLPVGDGQRLAFPLTAPIAVDSEGALRELLSEGEARVAALLVQGRSNREIADELILSPETVKAAVARILRKLGVGNRVEAAATILRLSAAPVA